MDHIFSDLIICRNVGHHIFDCRCQFLQPGTALGTNLGISINVDRFTYQAFKISLFSCFLLFLFWCSYKFNKLFFTGIFLIGVFDLIKKSRLPILEISSDFLP